MSIVQVIVVCSSPKAKTLSKPEPVQTGIKLCPQGIPVLTGFTVSCNQFSGYINAGNLYSIGYCWPTLDRPRHAHFAVE